MRHAYLEDCESGVGPATIEEMKILMAASEATPYAKTGGLADVLGALPFALTARGEEVAVTLPLYRSAAPFAKSAERVYDGMRVTLGAKTHDVVIRGLTERGVRFFFVDCPPLFDRDGLYGDKSADYPDNHIRFSVFSHAVLGIVRSLFRPDVLHCHDWQASLIAPLICRKFHLDPTYYNIKRLLTIHNLGYQGLFPKEGLAEAGLPADLFHPASMEFYGKVNTLKGGIVFSDAVSTVSKGYAGEIQTEEYGFGLDGLLRSRANVLTGILNGVDYSEWDPENDAFIAETFSVEDLGGKRACKIDLLEAFGLPTDDITKPVIGIVSRFATQKGFDLIAQIADLLAAEDLFLTVLGTGEREFEDLFLSLPATYPDKVAVQVTFSDELAHKVEAGADIFLMPSRYEPCGLNQIYSLRYGTVPVVRATGGLDDTINESNGFKFRDYTGSALLSAIQAALAEYQDEAAWTARMRAGMEMDFSWNSSAAEYSALYRKMCAA